MTKGNKIARILQKRKKGIPIKAKYTEDANISINKMYKTKYDKYQLNKHIKLVTNDIKIALIITPASLIMGLLNNQNIALSNTLYVISGSSLVYAVTNLYHHKKEKEKKFTLK